MVAQAESSTKQAATAIQTASKRIEGFSSGIKGFAGAAISALGALGAKSWLQKSLGEWQTAETTALKLSATLAANGREVDKLMERYRQFASDMQKVTIVGDDTTLSMLQQAESMGVTGDAAMRAVKNVIAAQAAGLPANVRMMAMLEQGNTMMLNRVLPSLRDIKDPTEKAAKAQELFAKMFAAATAEAQSSSGRIKQLQNDYGDFLEEIGKVVAEGIEPVVKMLSQTVKVFQSLSPEMKRNIVIWAALVTAILAIPPALVILKLAYAPLVALLKLVLLNIGIQIPLWIALTAVKVTYTVAVLTLKVALWLLTAALTAASIAAGGLAAVGLAAYLVAVGLAALVVVSALVALWKTINSLIDAFSNLTGLDTALAPIGNMFREWGGILRDVFRAAQVDMPLAWKLLEAGGRLALAQLEAMWPPFWEFIVNGFNEVAKTASMVFSLHFHKTIAELGLDILELLGTASDEEREKVKQIQEDVAKGVQRHMEGFKGRMGLVTARLEGDLAKAAVNPEIEAIRKEIDAIRVEIEEAIKKQEEQAKLGGEAIGAGLVEGVKSEVQKLDNVLAGSAEAQSRIREFQERLAHPEWFLDKDGKPTGGRNQLQGQPAARFDDAEARRRQERQNEILTDIAKNTKKMAERPTVEVEDADLG